MNAIGYVRVSTEDQAVTGVSLAAQEERVRAYCVAKGWRVLDVVVDAGQSASSLDRPGLQSILRNKAVNHVVVLKLDRLTRNVADLHTLLAWFSKTGVSLVAVEESLDTSTAAGRLMLNILTSVSQWEREAIGERTKTALAHLKSQGRRYSGEPPYGFSYTEQGQLVPNMSELDLVREITAMRNNHYSFRWIANRLTSRGFRARNGHPFHPSTVAQIVKRGEQS